jgi:hypothetical protein
MKHITTLVDLGDETMKSLDIIQNAISDIGIWTWWYEELPKYFLLEFDATQLWSQPREGSNVPSDEVSLVFQDVVSINIIEKKNLTVNLSSNWFEQLNKDSIDPFAVDYEYFSFNNTEIENAIVSMCKKPINRFGCNYDSGLYNEAKYRLSFMAGDIGMMIACNELELINHLGVVDDKDISDMNKKWWDYWKTYWKKRGTKDELPKDYACEITIPVRVDD